MSNETGDKIAAALRDVANAIRGLGPWALFIVIAIEFHACLTMHH